MTARPSRNSGARVKGLYDIPADSYVHGANNLWMGPHWVDSERFLQFGSRTYGTGSTSTNQFGRGATLFGLDQDDNPIILDQVDTASAVGFGNAAYSGPLHERGSVGTIEFIGNTVAIRTLPYGPFPNAYSIQVPNYAFQALRVVGDEIVLGPRYDFLFLTATAPPGPIMFGHPAIPSPDFIYRLEAPHIIGLSENVAMILSFVAKDGESGSHPWLAIHIFDPWNPQATLQDPLYPTVARQPDVLISKASLNVDDVLVFSAARRTDSEAVLVFTTYNSPNLATGRIQIVRLSAAGAVIQNTAIADWDSQSFINFPPALDMGSGVVHVGDLRIDASGYSLLGLPEPHNATNIARAYTSPTMLVDSTTYMYVHQDDAADPDELTFTFRNLSTDEAVRIVTSYADMDAEVAAMNQVLVEGYVAGPLREDLLVAYRAAGSYYARNNVVTIELGAGRQVGTAQVITEDRRFHRLPQGLS